MCAANLLRIVRGEVAYDRVRGVDGTLIDKPNATDEAVADAEWFWKPSSPAWSLTVSPQIRRLPSLATSA
mgnify:FL=1